jgi:hypothetical protein
MQDFAGQVKHPRRGDWAAKGMEGGTGYRSLVISGFDKLRQIFDSFFEISFFHISSYRPNTALDANTASPVRLACRL